MYSKKFQADRGAVVILWPLLGGAVLAFSGIWILPVCDTSESRYAEVAREMAAGGDWLVPRLMGEPHLTKPPLTYWLSALAMKVLGPFDWAARLPVAAAFLGAIAVAADLGRRIWGDPAAGLWSGWALVFSALPAAASNILTADSIVAFFDTAAAWCAWRSLASSGGREGRAWALGFHGALGLAFLAKGPPGLLVAIAVVPFALLWRRPTAARLAWPPALALFAAVALPWYAVVEWKLPGTIRTWLGTEVMERLAGDSHRNMSFLLYIPILLGGALPAGIALPSAARRAWRQIRSRGPEAMPAAFLAGWVILPFAVLCAAGSRLPLYLLPIFPPLALLAGPRLAAFMERGKVRPVPGAAIIVLAAGSWMAARATVLRVPAIADRLDLADPRPAAAAIAGDAGRSGEAAEVFGTSPPLSLTGNGLAFYLQSPVGRVNIRPSGDTAVSEPPAQPAISVLAGRAPTGAIRYFAVRPDKIGMFMERTREAGAEGRWILTEGPLWVWRRSAVDR